MRYMKYLTAVFLSAMVLLCVTGMSVQAEELSEEAYDISAETDEQGVCVGEPAGVDNGIPVVSLTIDPDEFQAVLDSPDHSYQAENCSIRIDLPEGYESGYGPIDASTIGRDLPLDYIRGRGNSTWLQEKKPFKIKLDKSEDLLAMGDNAHWVLLANYLDGTLLRNRLISYIGKELGLEYTPEFVPVDFTVNGTYMGSYVLCHQVRIDKNRVDIDKIKKGDTGEPEITGGYLLALEPYAEEAEVSKLTTDRGVRFLINTPDLAEYDASRQDAVNAQRGYIADYLQQTEDAVYGEDFRTAEGVSVSDLMDLESAAKYWLVQEFTLNDDAFKTPSSYLYKKRNGKLYWGPLWDFDKAFYGTSDSEYFNDSRMAWLDHLRQYNTDYQDMLLKNWDKLNTVIDVFVHMTDNAVISIHPQSERTVSGMNPI